MRKSLVYILTVVCIAALICMIVALSVTGKPKQAPFVPPDFDASAMEGTPNVPQELDWQELDAQVFTVGICGVVLPRGNTADLWLTNPKENQVWLKVRVLDSYGTILGETGLLRPGEYVQSVVLQSVPEVGSPITLKIMAYEPNSYYSAGSVTLATKIS